MSSPKISGHLQSLCLCAVIIPVQEPVLDVSRQTCAQGDEAPGILPKQILVHPRLIVEAVAVALGNDLHQVPVALIVLRQEHQMPHVLVLLDVLVEAGPGRRIDLTADHRPDPLLPALPVEIDDAEHDAVIRDRKGIHAQFLRPGHQIPDPGSAVQQTVFGMYVKMGKWLFQGWTTRCAISSSENP